MNEPEQEGTSSYDFSEAWGYPHAFAIIKAGLQKVFMEREDFSPENPYEQLITTLTATGMIYSAHQLRKNIEVRYGWEMLDDDNIVMHSCFGVVEKVDIKVKAKDLGFLLNLGDDEFGAFAYKDIFWVCEADSDQFK